MQQKVLNIGVISASGMAQAHMSAIVNLPHTHLSAICDIDKDKAQQAALKFNVSRVFTDYREMIKEKDIDAVVVCTPDHLHRDMTIDVLSSGKHVLCEKPMALTMEDCQAMLDAEKQFAPQLMIGQICRYTPGFKLTKELIDRGEIGELFFVESEYAHDYVNIGNGWRNDPKLRREPYIGGGCHALDLLRWIAGNPYEVTAYANHKCLTDWAVDDCTISILRFPNNVIGKVFVSIGCKRNYTMRSVFYGTKGTIIADNTSPYITVFKDSMEKSSSLFEGEETKEFAIQYPVNISNHNTLGEIDGFANAILAGEPVPTSAREGAATVIACIAAVESAKLGKPVQISYPFVD